MQIDAHILSLIQRTNPGDFAVYRVENGALKVLLSSPGLPSLSGMTPDEHAAVTKNNAAAIVLEADRKLVSGKLEELIEKADESAEYTLTFRILHKIRGFTWVRAKACQIGENEEKPVLMVVFETMAAASQEYASLLDNIGTSIYIIDKRTYELLYANGTAKQACGNRDFQNTQCFRYFNGLEAPCPWCSLPFMKDGAAHVDENYVPPLGRWFRHDVHDIKWYGRDAAAFYITNITEQKNKQKIDEERFKNFYRQIAVANPNALAMFRLNLTKNTCIDVQSRYEAAHRQQSSGTVDGYLAACAEIITDEEIRQDCLRRFNLPNLLKEFQNGVTEMTIEYPIRSSGGETIWIDGFITMMLNTVSGDIEGIAYALNVTGRKINNSILSQISEERYDHIGLINPATRSYELWKNDEDYGLDSHAKTDYDAAFEDILNHYIDQEDHDLFQDHGKIENIVARLNKDGSDSFVYRRRSKTGGCVYKQVKYVWLDAGHDRIIESQTDLTSLYEQQIEQVRQQHEAELAKKKALSAESIPAGIGVFDYREGMLCLNYLNNGFYQMMGIPREQYMQFGGSNVIHAVFDEDRLILLSEISRSIREKRQFRCRVRLQDGRENGHWVEIAANHVPIDERTERFYAAYYDVDELIRTQLAMQEKELVFRDILSYSDITYFTYYLQLHRYEVEVLPSRHSRLPMAMDDYPESFIRYIGLNEGDAQAFRTMVKEIENGASEAECTVFMSQEEESGWYRVHLMNVPSESGRAVRAIGNVFNVDRTVEAEKAISDERMRLESLRGVYMVTAGFNVTKDNETTFNAGGGLPRSAEIDAGQLAEARKIEPLIDRQNPETLSTLLSAAKQIPDEEERRKFILSCSHEGMLRMFRNGQRDVTLEYRREAGNELFWVSTRIILMAEPSTGDVLAFFYTRDITEQKKSERITKLTLEKNCDYIALINTARRTLTFRSCSSADEIRQDGWVPEKENQYDRNSEIAIERFLLVGNEGKLGSRISIENISSNLEKSDEYSVTYDRSLSDGKVHRKQIRYRWLDEAKNEILVVQTDITAAYIEEQERTRRLQEALAAAEKANSAKTEFISRISHDIRTPIGAITNMTVFAREDVDDKEKLLHDLGRIEASNTFLLSLINDVLDISKIDSGKIELHPEPYPYDEYIEGIRSIFEPLCRQNGQVFKIIRGSSAKGHSVLVDRVRYNQITLNLLSNAVKYTPAGGTITYESHADRRPDGMVECSFDISDTGIGMSEQFQKTMFDPFTQEFDNPERKKISSGTGLGLSIVKRLVDLMGGNIHVESKLGKGTRISVGFLLPEALPIQPENAGRMEDREAVPEKLAGTVLLAEDNVINTEIALRILDSFGLKADHAENGRKAVELFCESLPGQYRAVLMDIQMPVMNGFDAAREIRKLNREDAKTIMIIAMTADAFEESIRAAKDAGVDAYVTKPIDTRKLFELLKNNSGKEPLHCLP